MLHVDVSVLMERPKLAPHKPAIRDALAGAMGVPPDRVNVKATTGEKLGFVGREEGVAALAVATLSRAVTGARGSSGRGRRLAASGCSPASSPAVTAAVRPRVRHAAARIRSGSPSAASALGFLPGLPDVRLEPDLVLLIVLPPLLYAAAFFSDLRELRRNVRPIGLLAVGLVLVTTVAVAAVAHELIPGLSWEAAFVLGAVLGPTDPVAATAIAGRVGAPRRIVTILEGESLINDATALIAFKFAVAAATTGTFSLVDAAGEFVARASPAASRSAWRSAGSSPRCARGSTTCRPRPCSRSSPRTSPTCPPTRSARRASSPR